MSNAGHKIQQMLGCEEVMLYGRASTALYHFLCSVKQEYGAGEVIIPDMCCIALPLTVIISGFKPRFASVTPATFTITPQSVKEAVTAQTKAIIAVHLFGHTCECEQIKEQFPAIPLIEDCAQSIGARAGTHPHGTLGDVALLSFHPSKLVAAWGGALVVNEQSWTKILQQSQVSEICAPLASSLKKSLALSLRDCNEGCIALLREQPFHDVSHWYQTFADRYRPLFIEPWEELKANHALLIQQLERLPLQLDERRNIAKLYQETVQRCNRLVAPFNDNAAYWRFSFLADSSEERRELTWFLRENEILVSNHYFSLGKLFYNHETPENMALSSRVINLFTAPVTQEKANITCELIEKFYHRRT